MSVTDRDAKRQATIEMISRCARHQQNDHPSASPPEAGRGPEDYLYATDPDTILPPSDLGLEGHYPL
jgi:hypothetical protein